MNIIKVCKLFKECNEWEKLAIDFKLYKQKKIVPNIFGRDESLSFDSMYHIHYATTEEQIKRFSREKIQFYRIIKNGEEDNWLIYSHDCLSNEYLLITIIGPYAHNNTRWSSYLRNINSLIIEEWIKGRLINVEII